MEEDLNFRIFPISHKTKRLFGSTGEQQREHFGELHIRFFVTEFSSWQAWDRIIGRCEPQKMLKFCTFCTINLKRCAKSERGDPSLQFSLPRLHAYNGGEGSETCLNILCSAAFYSWPIHRREY